VKRAFKYGSLGLLLILVAGLVAPFIRADQYREQIRQGLQRALHRKVDIHGDTRLNLFRGPGFSIEQVVIHDDPSVGLEPMANVPELQATVRLSSLWSGKLEFATVRFVEPSLNIVKPDSGIWNLAPLLLGAGTQSTARLPEIQVSGGRLNFKFGHLKSAFYLTNTDLTVTPSGDGLDIRFSTAPARTDRSAQGYGLFTGRGRWSGGRIDIDVELEKSSIEELVTLARGQSLGLHGRIASRAKLSGPVADVSVVGKFDLEGIQRWDQIEGSRGSLAMNYRGRLDFGSQRVELYADTGLNPSVPLALKLIIADVLHNPNWIAEVALNRLPASAIVEAARRMGVPLPTALTIEGTAAGVIAYGSIPGVQGQIAIDDALVRLDATGPEFRLPHASILLSGDEIRLQPATLSGQQSRAAQVQAAYAPFKQNLKVLLTGRGLAISDLQDRPGRLLGGVSVPFLDRFKGGTWSGNVSYVSSYNEPGEWTARVAVQNTATTVPGLAAPLRVQAANIEVDGKRIVVRRLHAHTGNIEVFGEFRNDTGEERANRFALTMPSAELAELEHALAPALRRSPGFFSRTFRLRGANVPEWLRTRRAEGTLRIGTLTAGDSVFRAVRARVVWNGANVQLPSVEARYEEGLLRATAEADLTRPAPRYRLRGSLLNIDWRGGYADVTGSLETSGSGGDVLANFAAIGNYELRAVLLSPDLAVRSAAGAFDLSVSRGGPSLKLTVAKATVGSEHFTGEGATNADGKFHMDLASPSRAVRLTGPVLPLKLELVTDRSAR
jgi:hypothetical protein